MTKYTQKRMKNISFWDIGYCWIHSTNDYHSTRTHSRWHVTDRRRMKRLGGFLPIKLRSEKTMQSKPGGKSRRERERERWRYSLKQWNDQTDEGARAKQPLAPRAKHIACSSKLKDTNVAAVERQKTGEIIRVSSVKSQKLGKKKYHAPHTAHWLSKIKEERKERGEERGAAEQENGGEGRKGRRKRRKRGKRRTKKWRRKEGRRARKTGRRRGREGRK